MEQNLAQLLAGELRRRGNKSVKSIFWNSDKGNLSVFARGHTPENPKSFNQEVDTDWSIETIADVVIAESELRM